MTSTNDGKDVKSNQTSSLKGKSYYIDLYKSLEKHLSEECELRERTKHLCEAWRRVHSLCQHSAHTTHSHYLAWLQRHTADTLLQSEWQSEKDEHAKLQDAIDLFISESQAAIVNRNGHSPAWESQLLKRGEWFKKILGNPWGHPVLKVLCDPRGQPPSDEDIIEWLKEERGVMFVTRLRHLAASRKCHEIALSLATAVMDRKRAAETIIPDAEQSDEQEQTAEGCQQSFKDILRTEAGFTLDVWELLTDLELILLHKRNEHSQCIALAKKIPLRSGYQLVERLRSRPEASPREKKIWKNAGDVATIVAQVVITRCMVVPMCYGAVRSALYCCGRSLARLLPPARLPAAAVALAAPAATARHLHTLAAAIHTQLHAQHAEDMNSFVCELYVRAITAGMNELEKLKLKTEKESDARSMEQTLASWFTSLGSLLSRSARIQYECALTAFSVHPSQPMYDKIKMAPPLPKIADTQELKEETKSEFGSWANDSRSQTNLVKTSETLNLKQIQQHTNVMSTAIFAEGEAIGLSAELCQDLTVCLSGPRVKTFSWDMDREVLLENCRSYMERRHGGTRALTTELKYLNLDPSQYQHLPEEEDDENDAYYGIEKGYEHLVELQEEVGWQEAIFEDDDTETAYSSCNEFDEIRVRRKKKPKRVPLFSVDESDPLSSVAEENKGDKKKERPHSKERSKEKKKKHKDPESKEKTNDNKKKERKKKDKVAKAGSLASLIGVKVTRKDEIDCGMPTISDSDYDSQGKSSLASEGNDPNVVFDGLFSMDDPLSERPLSSSELSITNGKVAVNQAPKRKPSVKRKPKIKTNISAIDAKPAIGNKTANYLKLDIPKSRPSAVGVVSEQVKRSISKLLQFRRNQNAGLIHKNAQSNTPKVEHKPLNAIYKPEFPSQPFISPKSVIVPEIPKSYINKASLERSDADRNPPVLINHALSNPSTGHIMNRFENDNQHKPMQSHTKSIIERVLPQSTSTSVMSNPVNKSKDNVPSYYKNMNFNQHHSASTSPKTVANNHNNIQAKHISVSISRVETPRPQEHSKFYEEFLKELNISANPTASTIVTPRPQAHAQSYEEFLKELQTAANPPVSSSVIVNKEVRPISRVSPAIPPSLSNPDLSISLQSAKQVPQKKVENAPNTFSRLSYMKNKQSDMRHKQAIDTRQQEWNKQAIASMELSRHITEFKNTKIKYIQTKGDTNITRADNPLNLSYDNFNTSRKAEKSLATSRSNPIMANLLQSTTTTPHVPVSRNNNVNATKITGPTSGTSYLSEKDQNDLLLLLRQQNRINAARTSSKIGILSHNRQPSITLTTDNSSNKATSSNVMSKLVPDSSLKNNNIQTENTRASKTTSHFETPHDNAVINYSKNATNEKNNTVITTSSSSELKSTPEATTKESDRLDWEKVMNAIRAQKTPTRGPSALELTLKGTADISDKSLRNQRIVRTNPVGKRDKMTKTVDAIIKHTNNVNAIKPSTSLLKSSSKDVDKIIQDRQLNSQTKLFENKKAVKIVPPKISSGEMNKIEIVADKSKFAVSISKSKDPFISGCDDDNRLSDLDDLLDDELRRELGELSSDEDSYRIPQMQKGVKSISSSKNSITSSKQGGINSHKNKTHDMKSDSNLLHPASNPCRLDVIDEMLISKSNNPKSIDSSCVHIPTTKPKPKASGQSRSISKVACNEKNSKKVFCNKKSSTEVSNLSLQHEYCNTTSSNKNNINGNKVTDPSVHHQYSAAQSNRSGNKDTLTEKTAECQSTTCLLEQNTSGVTKSTRNAYVVDVKSNVYITVPQPTSNVVLLGTGIYYDPVSTEQNQLQSNKCVDNHTYVQPNNVRNLTISQPAKLSAPISVLHTNTVTVPVAIPIAENIDNMLQTSNKTIDINDQANSKTECLKPSRDQLLVVELQTSNKTVDINDQAISKTECLKPSRDQLLVVDELDKKAILDMNSNKNSERRALSEVQENKKQETCNTTLVKLPRNRSVSIEEPCSIKDIERLKRKRFAILNREIIKTCIHPPIALSYAPIFKNKKPELSINDKKIEVISQEIIKPPLKDDKSICISEQNSDKSYSINKIVNVISQDSVGPLLSTSDDTNKASNDEHSKENSSNIVQCRRILLRSSNKKIPEIPVEISDQKHIVRKSRVRLKPQTKTDKTKSEGDNAKQEMDKAIGIMPIKCKKKKVKRKTSISKCKKSNLINNHPVIEEQSESHAKSVSSNTTVLLNSDSFDIEDALLGSFIPNANISKPRASLDANEKSDISTDKADKVVILRNKKVALRRKRKPPKVVSINSDDIIKNDNFTNSNSNFDDGVSISATDNHRITRSVLKMPIDKKLQEHKQLQTEGTVDNNCLDKIKVSKKRQTANPNTNHVPKCDDNSKEENSKDIIVNKPNDETQSSNFDTSCNSIPIKPNTKDLLVSSEKIMNVPNTMASCQNTKTLEPLEEVLNSDKNIKKNCFQNIFEKSALMANNQVSEPAVEQINKIDLETHQLDYNKNEEVKLLVDPGAKEDSPHSEIGATKSELYSSSQNVVQHNIPNKISTNTAQLQPPTNDKTEKRNDIIPDHCNIPQSYKDSIIIEEIPNTRVADNVSKLLRVKLPNGKIFKASVFGKMHTSFDSLFEQPALRAMLMSNLNEQKKYTLNIKQVSTPNRENPSKPMKTRIQEIEVQSKNWAPPAVIDTIDLLSDDEESDKKCSFKTPDGVYKTSLRDTSILAKHQAKFDQHCFVKVDRLVLPKITDHTKDVLQDLDVIEIDGDSNDVDEIRLPRDILNTQNDIIQLENSNARIEPVISDTKTDIISPIATETEIASVPPIVLNTQNDTDENNQENIPDIIEIDESSNDSIDLLKNCPDFPVELIAGEPIVPKEIDIQGLVEDITDVAEIPETRYQDECKMQDDDTINIAKIIYNEIFKGFHSNITTSNEKIDNDESTIKNNNKMEASKTSISAECATSTFVVDRNEENLSKYLNCYVPLIKCDDLIKKYNSFNLLNRSCSVSLKSCDSIEEPSKPFDINVNDNSTKELDAYIDVSDAEVSSTASVSLLNDYSLNSDKFESKIEDGRSSPVIEVFEIISSLRKKDTANEQIKMVCHEATFECEMFPTKRQMLHEYNLIEIYENKNVKQLAPCITIPSLVSLLLVFFQNNSTLDYLKPVMKIGNTRVNKRKCRQSNLKRKYAKLADTVVASKVSKIIDSDNILDYNEKQMVVKPVINQCIDSDNAAIITQVDIVDKYKCEIVENRIRHDGIMTSNMTTDIINEVKCVVIENNIQDVTITINANPENSNNELASNENSRMEAEFDIDKYNCKTVGNNMQHDVITTNIINTESFINTPELVSSENQNELASNENSRMEADFDIDKYNCKTVGNNMQHDVITTNIMNTESFINTPELVSSENQNELASNENSRMEADFDIDKYNCKTVGNNMQHDVITTNIMNTESFINTPELVSSENQNELASNENSRMEADFDIDKYNCKTVGNNMQHDVITTNIMNTESFINTPELVSSENQNCETKIIENVRANITLESVNILTSSIAGNINTILENCESVAKLQRNQQRQTSDESVDLEDLQYDNNKALDTLGQFEDEEKVLEVDKLSNRNNKLLDEKTDLRILQHDNSMFSNTNLKLAELKPDAISTTVEVKLDDQETKMVSKNDQELSETSNMEGLQNDTVNTYSESESQQLPDIHTINEANDDGTRNIEADITSQSQQANYIMLKKEIHIGDGLNDTTSKSIEDSNISELSILHQRQFHYTIQVEDLQDIDNITEDEHESNNINLERCENIGVIEKQEIENTARKEHLQDNKRSVTLFKVKDLGEIGVIEKQEIEDSARKEHLQDNKRSVTLVKVKDLGKFSENDNGEDVLNVEYSKDVFERTENIIQGAADNDDMLKTTELPTHERCTDVIIESIEISGDITSSGNRNIDIEMSSDSTNTLKNDEICNNSCVALEVVCDDEENNDIDKISLSNDEIITDEIKHQTCEVSTTKNEPIVGENNTNDDPAVPHEEHNYSREFLDDIKIETQTSNEFNLNGHIDTSETHEIDSQDKCLLRGIEYEDPNVGTLYVLYPVEDSGSDTATLNDSYEYITETLEEVGDPHDVVRDIIGNIDDVEFLRVNIPKITYSKQCECDMKFRKNLKRKLDCTDTKFAEKKYRKGKNIDYPKITAAAILEQGYTKEYKRVFDYSSSIKFSYKQPFHKDYIDIANTLKDWPIQGSFIAQPDHNIETEGNLFTEMETKSYYEPNPSELSLVEEINQNYIENKEPSSDINETNFNMGFGEGSGRVIQNLEDVGDILKVSAATLSDVKQPQPFLLSENCEDEQTEKSSADDQIEKIQRYLTYKKLRENVKSFFQKTSFELKRDWLNQENKFLHCDRKSTNIIDSTNFPFDFYTQKIIEPRPYEAIVQVVQVGQPPVSTAAQNPISCDPRVTQVSNVSPSQCSVENGPHDESSTPIKTEYTELTTADLSLPLVQDYAQHNQTISMESHGNQNMSNENIPIETEIKSVVKIELMEELPDDKEELLDPTENVDEVVDESMEINHSSDEYSYDANNTAVAYETNDTTISYETNNSTAPLEEANMEMMYNCTEKQTIADNFSQQKGSPEKTDQIAHAMSAAGITTTSETIANNRAHALVNILSQKIRQGAVGGTTTTTANSYPKTTSINAMALQQALAQILPPPLNQTNVNDSNQQTSNNQVTSQVLHIVQGKNSTGSQITLVDNSQQSVISGTNATPVLHIVQNKTGTPGVTANGAPVTQTNPFSGLSLVDTGIQQGGNQLLHIVNTGSQKNNNAGQLLKRVNLLTNLTNVQGSNEQKMVQFVCKSADGKSIQLNAPHQRSMVLRLQPIESPVPAAQSKPVENQELNQSPSATTAPNKDSAASQQEIKSRSVYEENYAKFIQNSSTKPAASSEKSTTLPKFNQAFGKPVFQDGTQKSNEISNNLSSVSPPTENNDCQSSDNVINLEHISQISSPPLLLRKSPAQTSQAQTNLVQQIKQTIAPMNIQTMHGGVIYTRQIPVNIGGGQTINLITVPSTELIDESNQKQQSDVKFVNQGEIEPSIIKIVPQSQPTNNAEISSEDSANNMGASNENNQNPQPQPQPVLTQMRIKLPMLSKTPQMVSGARVVRPSFFQIQRNVIGGTNQPVYQQLVLTAAPPLGQQTIRLPTAQANRQQIKVSSESQSTESMSSSTLEQLREFDMVLEQVKERSTVQPNSNAATTFPKLHTASSDTTDTTDTATSAATTPSEPTQVLYSIGNNQSLNVAYVNRKTTVATPTTSTFVRSPDSSGIADSPTSSAHIQIPHTVTTESASSETPSQPKPAKIGSKSKSRPKSSSNPPNSMKINPVPPKTSTQKPLEDEQTTQRILYILAEYKEQVENSPDKDKPAPRRRSNPPSNPSGSSKRKKSSCGSRRSGGREMSPIHGDDTCRTMGSEDSSCGASQDCNESCLDNHSPQGSPRKIVRKLTFEHETPVQQPRPQPQRNVIVADGQTITVARGTAGKPTTAVLMPANYILPVSMVKGGQQIAIVTNRGPKLLTVSGEGGTTNALLLQRLIGPAGLKPVLARPGVRHVRLPTAALHNLQAFNLATTATVQPPDSTASPAPAPTPPELVETRAASSPWTDRESQEVKPERGSSPEGSEPWNLPSSADPHDYTYEETVRADNMERTVLDPIPDRYSPDMEAQRIFDKMFDVDSKKSYIVDSPRCGYDIDASDCDDKGYHQVVQKKEGATQRHHRLTHVSAAALKHRYAILEHELRLQKSLSEECEDLGVDSPSASELFPEAELLFAASPAHDHNQDQGQHSHTPQPHLNQSSIPQPDMDDQIATDQLLPREDIHRQQLELGLEDVGIVSVSEHGMQAIALDQEEFARAHPNTTFHSEPTDDAPVQPFTIAGLKARHITSTIFHSNRVPTTVLMTAPQATVISQAAAEPAVQNVKYSDIDNMINSLPSSHNNLNLSSVLVKDDGLTRFDNILNDSRELHLTNTASAIVHSTGNATQVIRRVCYDDKRDRDTSFLMDEPDAIIAGDDAKMIAEDSRDATLESMADVDDDRSSPERHTELFWESNSASEPSESRRPLDFSSDSDKCCKSPSYDETNSTDSSGVGTHMRLDSVIKNARGMERSGSADGSSADDTHPPLRTYPPKRMYHPLEGEMERSMSGKTRAGERSPDSLEVRRRASGRGVVKRGCHCCSGSPAPPRPKKSRQRKPIMDFHN